MVTPLTSRPVAIVTGGTRGIGAGISEALLASSSEPFNLILNYGSNKEAAEKTAKALKENWPESQIELVGGDLTKPSVREEIFKCYDKKFASARLAAVIHNAGQYVGITADNCEGVKPVPISFGDGSILKEGFGAMHYYQKLYGDAFIDLMERGLERMSEEAPGSLIGISSPGCTQQYNPNAGYDMPGSGKCIMEYSMRLFALKAAKKKCNCNVVIPGVTETEAWGRLADTRGANRDEMVAGIASRIVPMECTMTPRELGDVVAFLCSKPGRCITGVSLPADFGVHLKT
ncbi:hypothetical protein TrVE_jg408 [Triparma verrucosa]|uniref:Uncharacterized protein n=1 Tax=Triparma verrucosa TaxID=1606542 RepID=A0A9W7CJU5_9STRA|nr:hypothetical protein TrVE_jg408 [Triparma verrucosa]